MRVNLYTDAPHHNLALMQLSAHHKGQGDSITLNMPIMPCDYSYASVLFEKNRAMFNADEYGGPAVDDSMLSVNGAKPDYSLFPIRYSLGYTFRPCFRRCPFCKVWRMKHPDTEHHSIWEFHNSLFDKICLLNNNTFFDKQWRETFEEIWDANLTVVDENGYDLRLMDEEKADSLRRTRFAGKIHYAWDRMKDETAILRGLAIAPRGHVYVLIGYDTTEQEDLYRCQKIIDNGHDPYIMPYNQSKEEKRFKRFIDLFMWRKYPTIEKAWGNYKG
jgi:radical SAM superfamily enzyme YgiQ (UPF0313 family)